MRSPLPTLALTALLAGCDRDPATLAREIEAARGDCSEARLRAASEECVQMMERYAQIGVDAMHTYVGAVRSLDQALRRMPPVALDTTGLGHALSAGMIAPDSGTTSPVLSRAAGSTLLAETDPAPGIAREAEEGEEGERSRWSAGRGRAAPRGWDPRDPAPGRPAPEAPPGPPAEARDTARARPRRSPPDRGLLLPPAERLDRPWLRAEPRYGGPDEPRYLGPHPRRDPPPGPDRRPSRRAPGG